MKSPYIIIVGGVAGGASAAAKARRVNEHAEITIFEKGPYVSFANCGLPYMWERPFKIVELLPQVLSPFDKGMAALVASHLEEQGIQLILGDGIQAFHGDHSVAKEVELQSQMANSTVQPPWHSMRLTCTQQLLKPTTRSS